MKIVIDDKIPYIKEAMTNITNDVIYASGQNITKELIKDADALIVRTRTLCNRELLEGSHVKFIATATIGFDHIDTAYCKANGIAWTNAPGCNSDSVAQYIESTLLILQQIKKIKPNKLTIGIVGVGHVGQKVANIARRLGMTVLLNDPPRAEQEGSQSFVSLQHLTEECDIITFHVPLHREGTFKTFHLGNRTFFSSLKKKPIIINTSRGEILETKALLEALHEHTISDAVIDVWENEPNINQTLLSDVFIGTPHIAGYSADGKANATQMSLDAVCRFFNIKADYQITPPLPASANVDAQSREEALLKIYNPLNDSDQLKKQPNLFEWFRGNYPLRREEKAYHIHIDEEIKQTVPISKT